MKKIFVCLLTGILAASLLASCNNELGEEAGETTADTVADSTVENSSTTGADTTTGAPVQNEEPKHPGVDVLKIELSECVVLGNYKQTLTNNVYCDDEELAEKLLLLAKENDYYKKVTDRVTVAGDVLNVSFEGRIEDVYFEGGTSSSSVIELVEDNGYIDGFDADLYGIMPGTTVETTVTFPEDYQKSELAGVEAVFEITVNYIYDYTFTDETVKQITNGKYETAEEFTESFRENIIKSNLESYDATLNEKIVEMVLENSEIKSYPQELVNYLYDSQMDYYEYYAEYYGLDIKSYLSRLGLSENAILENAKAYAKEDLVLHAIFLEEGLSMSDAEYRVELAKMAAQYGYSSSDEIEEEYGEYYMRGAIIKDLCLKHLRETLTVETDKAQYEHLLTESTTAEENE